MASNDNVILLNDYSDLEKRTTKSGKARYTVKISAEPLAFNLDAKALGAPIAQAIALHLREQVRGIAAAAAPATIKARKVAAKAYAEGKAWAVKRYAGGRTGARPPNQRDRAFNDSGRFAETIVASASKDNAWRINVAANRLDPSTSGGVERVWSRLTELVPAFRNINQLISESDFVRKSIENAARDMVAKGRMGATGWDVLRQVVSLAQKVGF